MPECSEIVEMLSDYLDRDLPPETCVTIDAHLAHCAACGEAMESLRRTVSACKQFRTESKPGPLPSDKHEQLRSALEKVLSDMQGR